MDLSVIAALMGVGEHEQRQREAWDAYGVTPAVPMVKKVREAPSAGGGEVPSPP